jgi:hypothetical protein
MLIGSIDARQASRAYCDRLTTHQVAWLHHDELFRLKALDNFDPILYAAPGLDSCFDA